jgi:hypothetical protein
MGRGLQPEVAAAARSSASTMAAAVFRSFGPPSVLQLVRAATRNQGRELCLFEFAKPDRGYA